MKGAANGLREKLFGETGGVGIGGVSDSDEDFENRSDNGGAGGGERRWDAFELWREREEERLGKVSCWGDGARVSEGWGWIAKFGAFGGEGMLTLR